VASVKRGLAGRRRDAMRLAPMQRAGGMAGPPRTRARAQARARTDGGASTAAAAAAASHLQRPLAFDAARAAAHGDKLLRRTGVDADLARWGCRREGTEQGDAGAGGRVGGHMCVWPGARASWILRPCPSRAHRGVKLLLGGAALECDREALHDLGRVGAHPGRVVCFGGGVQAGACGQRAKGPPRAPELPWQSGGSSLGPGGGARRHSSTGGGPGPSRPGPGGPAPRRLTCGSPRRGRCCRPR
jgi:hypothetical protein